MKETRKTKAQLISELEELRQRIAEFEQSETEFKRTEETHQQSEERFRSLVETTTDWFWEVDENAVYTYSSPKIRDLLGYEPEEILGKTPFSLMPPEEADRVAHIFTPYAESHKPFELLENTNIHKDGHLVVLETSGIPIFDANGVFRGYRGIDRDITERKQAEQAILASEMRLRTAIESLPFDFFIIDKDGRYIMQNSTCKDRWGDLIGKRTEDLEVDEDNLTLWLNNNRRAFAGEVVRGEVELRGREGKGFFYNIIAPVTDGDQIPEILGVNIDITERKRAEEELRKAHDEMEQKVKERTSELLDTNEQLSREIKNRKGVEERLRENEAYMKGILNAAPIGIGLVHNRIISWISDPLCSMLGYSEDELIGQSARIAYESDEEFQRVGEVKYSEIQERGVGTVETRLKRKNGNILDVLLCSAAIDPEDFSKGTIFTALDITERKRAEEALKESEKELREQTKALEEANIALRVLLSHRDEEKKRLEDTVLSSLQKLITPYLQRLKETILSTEQQAYVDVLVANLSEVSSPFTDKLSSKCPGITPREHEIAGLIKAGKKNVEIADLLGITENSVSFHRKNLRSKLGLKQKKVNLRSHLLSLV